MPIAGNPKSLSFWAPANEPSPPITTKQSILYFLRIFTAFNLPSSVLNSSHLEDFNIVPPLCIISPTEDKFISVKSSSSNPLYPLLIPYTLHP